MRVIEGLQLWDEASALSHLLSACIKTLTLPSKRIDSCHVFKCIIKSVHVHAYICRSKSSASISQRNYFRRSGHTSFSGSMEGDQLSSLATVAPMSATLPRNGQFFNSPSFTKLAPLESECEVSNDSLIPLTQTVSVIIYLFNYESCPDYSFMVWGS